MTLLPPRRIGVPAHLVRIVWLLLLALVSGCSLVRGVHTEMKEAAATNDPLVVSDALEALIEAGRDRASDRAFALDFVRSHVIDTAPATFAYAAVAGRYVQSRGLLAVPLLGEVEYYARRSRQLDPHFRNAAATRMLGTLYVIAPAKFVKYGNSETGIEMLEELVDRDPKLVENHLRLAEGYISLGDVPSALPHLCESHARRSELRADEARLLDQLIRAAGGVRCP